MANNIVIPTDLKDEVALRNFLKLLLIEMEKLQLEIDSLKSV